MNDPRGGIQYEPDGRPYVLMPDGRKNYISPAAYGAQTPADNTGILHKAPQWNQYEGKYETPFDWGNLVTMLTAGGLTAGVGSAAFGGGAAAAGAGGGAEAASTGAGLAGVEGGGFGLSSGATGALGGGYAAGTGPGLAAGSGFTGSGAAGAVSPLLKAGKALAGAAPVIGAMTSGQNGKLPPLGTGFQEFLGSNPQFSNLLNNQVNQSNRNDELHKALTALSMRLLPNSARGNY